VSGPVGLERFRRVSDDVRRVRVHRRGDVVGAALVLQVCRSVMRLSATVEDVDALAALGIRAGFDTPLPEVASPGHVIATFEGPGIRHAARVGVAIALSMALANGFHLPYGYWLPITVMFCLRDSYGGTVERVTQRVGGATVGAIGAALALAVAPGLATLVILVFVGAAFGFALAPVNHLYWMTFATPLTMLLIDFTQRLAWHAAGWRIALTVAGGAIALVAARALWPAGTLRLVPGRLDQLLHTHAELVRTVATRFAGRPGAAVHERLADAAAAAVTLEDSLVRLGQEPTPPVDPLRRLREATTIARRLRDYLATLDALTEDRPVDAGPVVAVLRRVADHLDGTDPGDLDLGDLLRELDDHLACLCRRRKAEIARSGDADMVTALREALVQVAGARHAVRALAADADRLAHESRALTM
jgi:uncharacterized membrane protein YccC